MFNVFAGSGTASNAGIFIPLADLPGLSQSELATTGSTLEANLVYAMLNALYSAMAPMTILGIANLNKSQPAGTGTGRFSEAIGFAYQRLINFKLGTVGAIPIAVTGTEAGMGSLTIEDIFPGAAIVSQGGAITGAGIVVPSSLVSDYGASTINNIDDDARAWVGALLPAIAAGVTVRSATVESAITSRTLISGIRSTGVSIPAAWYDAANPLTNISAADLPWLRVIQDQVTIEYEMAIDADTQTLSLSVRTA
jgi:hypothetical protein